MGAQDKERKNTTIKPTAFRSVFKDGTVQALREVAASGRFPGVTVTTLATPGHEYDLPNTGLGYGRKFGQQKGIVPEGMEWVIVADARGKRLEELQREAAAILTARKKAGPSGR